MKRALSLALVLAAMVAPPTAATEARGDDSGILVTFDNVGASRLAARGGAPYRFRKRYGTAVTARESADAIAREYGLVAVKEWPIRSLAVLCLLYRVPNGADRADLIAMLESDDRVESAQALHVFETMDSGISYDDTYASLQHGLASMGIASAHRYATGGGVRVAVIDSIVDAEHEDLRGRIARLESFVDPALPAEKAHGTAVASVIGAQANNARGIVGVAPGSTLEVMTSCWADAARGKAVCDSFSLAQALDFLLLDPPQVVNLSLVGPPDPLIERLLAALDRAGAILVAAQGTHPGRSFPASMPGTIAVSSVPPRTDVAVREADKHGLYAIGERVMVAVPDNAYDFRSGTSLAAAHVSGVIALLLEENPGLGAGRVADLLHASQVAESRKLEQVNACRALRLLNSANDCR